MRAERLEKKMQRANETVKKMYIIMPQAQNSREIINEKVKWSESAVEMMLQMAIFFCDTITTTSYKLKRQANTKNSFRKVDFKGRKKKLQVRRESKCQKKKVRLWNSVSHSHLLQKLQKCVKIGPHTITHFEQGLKIWKNFSRSGIRSLTYLIKAIYVISIKDDDPHASSLFCLKIRGKSEKIAFSSDFCGFPSTGE